MFQDLWNFPDTDLDLMDEVGYEEQSCCSDRNRENEPQTSAFSFIP